MIYISHSKAEHYLNTLVDITMDQGIIPPALFPSLETSVFISTEPAKTPKSGFALALRMDNPTIVDIPIFMLYFYHQEGLH